MDTATKRAATRLQILSIVREEMTKIRDNDVSDKELSEAKSYMIGSMPLELTSTNNISALMLTLRLDKLPIDYLDTDQGQDHRGQRSADIRRAR